MPDFEVDRLESNHIASHSRGFVFSGPSGFWFVFKASDQLNEKIRLVPNWG